MHGGNSVFRMGSWKSFLLFVLLEVVFGAGRDFYKILGVSRKADDGEIKKAYRGLSRKWHPDQNPDNVEEATQMFYDISDAYETLSDPEKRAKYDLGGEDAVNGQGGPGGHPGRGQRGDPFEQFRTFFQFFGEGGQQQGFHGGFHGGFPGGGFHQPGPQNLYDDKSGVTEIGKPADWGTIVDQRSGEIVIVDFYSPSCGPCQALRDEYISVAKTFKGIVKVAAVNCAAPQAAPICQSQKVSGYPTIRMYADKAPIQYSDREEKNAKNIGNWISNSMPDVTHKITSEATLKSFVAQSAAKAIVILFSDKKQTPPLFKSLCRSFHSSAACGAVLGFDPKTNLPKSLISQVSKTPSLIYLHDSATFEGELFKGSMTAEILSLFFSRIVSHRSRQVTVDQLTAARPNDCSSADATTCVLLLETPSTGSHQYEILKQVAERFKSDPVKFFWVDPKSKFAKLFENVSQSKIVAYRGKRGKYSVFEPNTATTDSVNSWLDNIVSGGAGLSVSIARKPKHDEL